jgi:prephenate dehydratase
LAYFTEPVHFISCPTFYETVLCVQKKQAHLAMLPVENTIVGCITHTFDLLLETKLQIIGEVAIPVHHCLIAPKRTGLRQIKKVYSHPVALSQCEHFLRKLGSVDLIPTNDTAGSAKLIAKQKDHSKAAIASRKAAEMHHLQILAENIEDYPDNQTRFLLVQIADNKMLDSTLDRDQTYKTSIVFNTADRPGCLAEVLHIFKAAKINLTSLHSRPVKSQAWHYMFFADLHGHERHPDIAKALNKIKMFTSFFYLLGSYPAWKPAKRKKPICISPL